MHLVTKKISRPDPACATPWKVLMPQEPDAMWFSFYSAPSCGDAADVNYFYAGAHILGSLPSTAYFLLNAFFAASSITATIFAGSSRMDMWQVERVVVIAPIFFAAASCIAGGSI